MSKKISIIIPTLNEALGLRPFLTELQALRSQCELIVVDGGSDDDTIMIAEEYVDDVVKTQQGRAIQMNTGAAMASTPLLWFLHADSRLPDNAINAIDQAIHQGYQWGHFDIKLSGKSIWLSIIVWMMNRRARWTGIATGDQALFVDKQLFEQLDGFADISLMEDIELCSRLKNLSKPYCIQAKLITSSRRWIRFGIVKTVLLMWWLRLQFYYGVSPKKLEYLYRKGLFWSK